MRHISTCEQVRAGHPDKLCDQIADTILDSQLALTAAHGHNVEGIRAGIEVLAKDDLVILSGEIRAPHEMVSAIDYEQLVRGVVASAGYENAGVLKIHNYIGIQQPELQASSDRHGAGDQGIMIGFATRESPQMLPLEFVYVTAICRAIDERMFLPSYSWLRPDGKAQVTLDANGKPVKIVVGVQHTPEVDGTNDSGRIQEIIKDQIIEEILRPMFGDALLGTAVLVNGTGSFAIGGPAGDAGVVGRKIVCDAYGPSVAVGGGAFSGKDPTKVDRSAAYMARFIAKSALAKGVADAESVTVRIAYAIGSSQPEMLIATTDSGVDISTWASTAFPDLSPPALAERLELWHNGSQQWTYADTAKYGHFGREAFPWERVIAE